MATPAVRQAASAVSRTASSGWAGASRAVPLAEKLEQYRLTDAQTPAQQAEEVGPARPEVLKSFAFHLGADLQVPTDDKRKTHTVDAQPHGGLASEADPFDGLPLKAWAERMGERIMPAYELIKEEQKRAKHAARTTAPLEVAVPAIPHLLPFTRWASKSQDFRSTFVAEDPKLRKKARLSWYHPDDTMVPRNWFKGGLLEDLKYYAPFSRSAPPPQPEAAAA